MVRLGVIGYGIRAHGVIEGALRKLEPDLRVTGIIDPNEEAVRQKLSEADREEAVFYKSLDALVRKGKVDALLIATRCNMHTPYAVKAAKYDLPLFLEKPVAVDMRQATQLEKAFSRTRCKVVVGFPLRVTRICEFVRQRLDEGAVGRREHVLGVNYVPYGSIYFEGGYRDYDVTRGLFLQKATHDLDAIDSLMDSPVVRVAAMHNRGRVFGGNRPADLRCSDCDDAPTCPESPRNRVRNRSGDAHDHLCVFSEAAGDPESGMNEDSSSCLMEFASGAHGVYTQIFFARRDAAARGATVSGYDGTLSFDWPSSEARYVRHHAPFSDTIRMEEGGAHFGGDEELAADFLGLLRGRQKTVRTPIETGLRSVYTCLACQKSAETGRFVDVRQVGF